MSLSHRVFITLTLLALGGVPLHAQDPALLGTEFFTDLQYRHIGPVGNRVSAVVGVPGNPNLYYIGAASGGVWKTVDGGVHWEPVFDDQPAQSIGALAVDPRNPNVVWAGTGEAHIRSNVSIGNGVYKTTDGGRTWTHMGLEESGRIARIRIHPFDPDIVFVAALGHLYGPQEERGVFRTTDGGATWERILFTTENAGASDIVMDPNNPEVLFAGFWEMVIWTWGRQSGGPGSGLFRSMDGGESWERLEGHGLPEPPIGKVVLGMTPDDSDRIYALIETNSNRDFAPMDDHQGVLWRSDDGGDSWRMVNADHTLVQRPHYYSRVVVAPDDKDEVHFLATSHTTSLDGGLTVRRGSGGGDNHDMWIDPLQPDRMIIGNDGGVHISTTRGDTWLRPRMPIAQMYHAYTDNQIPYFVYGNRQDGASHRGPSNSLTGGSISIGEWHSVGGCESGFAIPDPVDNNIVWSGCYEGILDRYDVRTGHARNVSVWPDNPEGWPAGDLRYRFQWTFPVAISPHDHNRVYVGSQHVHMTTDGGQSYRVISPDLTSNDKSKQEKTGGLTPDDASPTYAAVLFAIAESPLEEGVIWTGSNDGLVHVTRDGGGSWADVTENIPDLPPWGTISNIEPSRFHAGTAYISVDLHQVGNTDPYAFKTSDYGESWTLVSRDIPESVFSYVHVIREDPVREGLLYLGTENAVYVSFNEGSDWVPLQANLPHAPAHWLTVQEHFNDLVVGTYGRGFWILDDVTPLQQLTDEVMAAEAHLFRPRPAYRFRNKESRVSQPEDPGAGQNPRYGASIHLLLGDGVEGAPSVSILDGRGEVVRRLSGVSSEPGLHRVYWDLRYESSPSPRMRTPVLEHSHVEVGDDGWRPAGDGGRVTPLAPPGEYTVRLTVGGEEYTQPLIVLKDPNSTGTEADIQAQFQVILQLREEAEAVVDLINEAEIIRAQLDDLEALGRIPAGEEGTVVRDAATALDEALIELEMGLTDLRLSGGSAGQDALRWPRQLFAKITSLAGYIGSSDFRPTDQHLEVHRRYQGLLAEAQERMEAIRRDELAALNRVLEEAGVDRIGRRSSFP
ncbi:MAG: WD40/YVTN/BNR-like repeat-containing protein [Longimicrobiales bacterium]